MISFCNKILEWILKFHFLTFGSRTVLDVRIILIGLQVSIFILLQLIFSSRLLVLRVSPNSIKQAASCALPFCSI
jgi:hypothetical protein